jgi:hypothetical protein
MQFHSGSAEDDVNKFEKTDFKVIMPRNWTPKMYLGALYQSIRMNSLLTLESINVSGRMNELNWLFPLQKDIILHAWLVTSASYLDLYSGQFPQNHQVP